MSKALVTILKHNNYAVDAVFDGQQALDYLECGIYDGLILDLMMPKVDGITVLKTIRRKGNKIPVLILTTKSEVRFGLRSRRLSDQALCDQGTSGKNPGHDPKTERSTG